MNPIDEKLAKVKEPEILPRKGKQPLTEEEIAARKALQEKNKIMRKTIATLDGLVRVGRISLSVQESGLVITPLKIDEQKFITFKKQLEDVFSDPQDAKKYYEKYLHDKSHVKKNGVISLRVVKTENVEKEEFNDLYHQIKHICAKKYNETSGKICAKIVETNIARGSEALTIKHLMNDAVYHPFMDVIHNAYIALFFSSKMASSISGSKVWDIKEAEITAPQTTHQKVPLGFYNQNGFKISEKDGEFLLEVPFTSWERLPEKNPNNKEFRPWWEKFKLLEGRKTNIQFLISTKTRKKRKRFIKSLANIEWEENDAVAAQIQRVLDGTHKVTTIEIIERKDIFYINFNISWEEKKKELDQNKIVGIHFGGIRPVTLVLKDSKQQLSIYPNIIKAMNDIQSKRIREQRRGNRYRKGGHGITQKLAGTESHAIDYRQRRKKIMEEWINIIVNFCINNNAGIAYVENASKNKDTAISYYKFPVAELIKKLSESLKDAGTTPRDQITYFVNQICSACRYHNKGYTYAFRKENKFPKFKCADCLESMHPDINAARNIANGSEYKNLLIKKGLLKIKSDNKESNIEN